MADWHYATQEAQSAQNSQNCTSNLCMSFWVCLSVQSALRSAVPSRGELACYDGITEDPSLALGMTYGAANQFSRTPRASELLYDRSSRLLARPPDSGKMISASVSIPNGFPSR